MKTTVEIRLSKKSVHDAINEIRKYQRNFNKKLDTFIYRLGDIGIDVVNNVMAEIPDKLRGNYGIASIRNKQGDMVGCTIQLTGKQILFIEFSAGIRYGTNDYPIEGFEKYGMGTYNPTSDKWKNPKGWYYRGDDDKWHHSYGNKAYMPMYKAEMAILLHIREIAMEVFG